jgi:L-iditol 2-dehydrogenase
MKALRKTTQTPGELTLCDIPEPSVGNDEVLIRVHAGGLCGTDMHIREGGYGSHPPVTLGHEIGGEVIAVGPGSTSIVPGDRVTVNPTANGSCGRCRFCHQGIFFFCPERRSIGSGIDGGFAEYLAVPAHLAFTLPATIPFEGAAMVEPFACCVKAVFKFSHVSPGDIALVCGPGPIGLMCAWLALQAGARVVVAGTSADGDRLIHARTLGVAEAVNVEETDVVQLILEMSNGYGADVVLDCGGTRGSVNQCLHAAANCGRFIQVALIDHPFEIDWGRIVYKQLSVQGTIAADWPSWDRALTMAREGQVDLSQFITHTHALEDWETAFAHAEGKIGLKQILKP